MAVVNLYNPLLRAGIQKLGTEDYNIWGYVTAYSDLPLGTTSSDPGIGDLVGVNTETGSWVLTTLKRAGFYKRSALTGVVATDYGTTPIAGFPLQATQAEVDTATDDTKFITPLTLNTTTQLNTKFFVKAGLSGGQTAIGGTGISDILKLQGTSANGTSSAIAIQKLVGNNGDTIAETILNNGLIGINTISPSYRLDIKGIATTDMVSSDMGFNINQVANPASLSGVKSAGSELGIGIYYYYLSYITATGETNTVASAAITTTSGQQQITLTIPISSNPNVTGRKLYRTKVGTASYLEYYMITIDNVITTYIDLIPDSSLTVSIAMGGARYNTTTNYITINANKAIILDKYLTIVGNGNANNTITGVNNTIIGNLNAALISTAISNVILGSNSANKLTTGNYNIAIGDYVLPQNSTAANNIGIGWQSLFNCTGASNIAIGIQALRSIVAQTQNTAIGAGAGAVSLGSNSIFIGSLSGAFETVGNKLYIDSISRVTEARGRTESLIYGVFSTTLANQILSLGGGGRVGINNIAPAYTLDVKGSTTTDLVSSDMGFNINQVANPTTLTGVPSTGSGLEIGDYYYYVTYTTALGETNSLISAKITTTSGNQQVTLTIPVSSDPRVVGRKLYRCKVNLSHIGEYYLATISNNTNVTYIDSIADASLAGNVRVAVYRFNTTSKNITKNNTQLFSIDSNGVSIGYSVGGALTSGGINTLIGSNVGNLINTGYSNIGIGVGTLTSLTGGIRNITIGNASSITNSVGNYNVAIGDSALSRNTGSNSTAIGASAGYNMQSSSVAIGCGAGYYETVESKLYIDSILRGTEARGRTESLIYGVFSTTLADQRLFLAGGGRVGINTIIATYDLSFGGVTSKTIGVERNTTADTAGSSLTIASGAATSGATDKDGGMFVQSPGLSTGTAKSSIRKQRLTRQASTSTSDNTLIDAFIIPSEFNLTNSSANSLFEVALPTLKGTGGEISFSIFATDGTDIQQYTGIVLYTAVNKAGTYSTSIVESISTKALSAGTLKNSWSILEGTNKVTIQVTPVSSLTNTTYKIRYNILNHSGEALTQL